MKRHSPKTVYWTTYGLAFLVVCVLQVICRVAVHRFFGDEGHFSGLIGGFVSGLILFFPPLLATLVCRRLGLSKAGQQVEIIERGNVTTQVDETRSDKTQGDNQVKIRNSPDGRLIFAVIFTLMALIVASILLCIPEAKGRNSGFLMSGVFTALALSFWVAYLRGKGFVACADAEGVQGKDTHNLQTKLIVWKDIQSCEITVLYGVLGDLHHTNFVFKSKDDNALLSVMTAGIPEAQTRHFKNVIEYHLSS